MENTMNKKVLIGIVAIVVLAWAAVSVLNKPAVIENSTPATETASSSNSTAVKNTTKSATTGSQPVTQSYENALALYTGNNRIQLSGTALCQASPTNVTYKNGTSIMIDNRSAQTRTIKLGTTFTIPGYGFKIIKLSSTTLPTTLIMDCGTQQNIAKVLLQK